MLVCLRLCCVEGWCVHVLKVVLCLGWYVGMLKVVLKIGVLVC